MHKVWKVRVSHGNMERIFTRSGTYRQVIEALSTEFPITARCSVS